jgi:hypothetical protein
MTHPARSSRRAFLKTSLAAGAASTLAGLATSSAAAAPAAARDFYEVRAYRLKPGASDALVHSYLEKALVPALNARGVTNVGVFTELDVDKKAGTSKPKLSTTESPASVWVFISHPTFESFLQVSADLNTDAAVQKAGADFLLTPKSSPAYDRVDVWLLRAFAGFPRTQIPAFSKSKVPTRIFEMRDYESHSEERAINKMEMFNNGEIDVMKDLNMSPVFFGQALAGPNLPHLRYITSGADLTTHLNNWKAFGPHPIWTKLKNDPLYKDNTSKNTARFLAPTAYSQI